jgi:hypothetical protein
VSLLLLVMLAMAAAAVAVTAVAAVVVLLLLRRSRCRLLVCRFPPDGIGVSEQHRGAPRVNETENARRRFPDDEKTGLRMGGEKKIRNNRVGVTTSGLLLLELLLLLCCARRRR